MRLLDARNCRFDDCEITAIGNYALEIGPGCEQNRILRCDIHDLGAGGFLIGPKIRPPSDKENPNRTDFPPVLDTPFDACSENEIADCCIYDGGRYYHCAVGTNNILLSNGTPIYAGGYAYQVNTPGAFKADSNRVWSTAGEVLGAQDRFPSRLYEPNESVMSWPQWQALGNDRNSVIADPGFKDPANDDFRLPEDSPARSINFKPFPLDEAGPR